MASKLSFSLFRDNIPICNQNSLSGDASIHGHSSLVLCILIFSVMKKQKSIELQKALDFPKYSSQFLSFIFFFFFLKFRLYRMNNNCIELKHISPDISFAPTNITEMYTKIDVFINKKPFYSLKFEKE